MAVYPIICLIVNTIAPFIPSGGCSMPRAEPHRRAGRDALVASAPSGRFTRSAWRRGGADATSASLPARPPIDTLSLKSAPSGRFTRSAWRHGDCFQDWRAKYPRRPRRVASERGSVPYPLPCRPQRPAPRAARVQRAPGQRTRQARPSRPRAPCEPAGWRGRDKRVPPGSFPH